MAYQACLENRLTVNSAVRDDEAIDKCAEQVTNTIQEALAASAPKRRPLADSRPSLPRPKTQANPFFPTSNTVGRNSMAPWGHS